MFKQEIELQTKGGERLKYANFDKDGYIRCDYVVVMGSTVGIVINDTKEYLYPLSYSYTSQYTND